MEKLSELFRQLGESREVVGAAEEMSSWELRVVCIVWLHISRKIDQEGSSGGMLCSVLIGTAVTMCSVCAGSSTATEQVSCAAQQAGQSAGIPAAIDLSGQAMVI